MAQAHHLEKVADIFYRAFHDSIVFFADANDKTRGALEDVFALLLQALGPGFMVAVEEDKVVGYIVMAEDIRRLWIKSISSGSLLKMAVRTLAGKYGLKLSTLYKIVKNKLLYMKFEVTTLTAAQILSVAVDPKHQSRGIGKSLIAEGLRYIDDLGIDRIKLEVRPENTAALKTYQKFGFVSRGIARDLQGDWIVMVRKRQIKSANT
jgi:ribosomal-protein-alanine N-acetyltransferase